MDWEPTALDLEWASQEASNFMYSDHMEWDSKDHQKITEILLFGLQRLEVHVDRKTDHPHPAWKALFERTPEPMPMTACRVGYEYALQHIPVEL